MCTVMRTRARPYRRPSIAILLLAVASATLAGCEVEEQLHLAADGTGSYQARVTVDHAFAAVLSRLKDQADRRSFQIIEETSDANGQSVILARDFERVSDLDDDSASYRFEIERRSPLRRAYRLTVELRDNFLASGFDRRLVIRMPAPIRDSSAGEVSGETVVWDCSEGGTLILEAEGYGASAAWRIAAACAGLLVVVTVAGAGWWLLRRGRRTRPR